MNFSIIISGLLTISLFFLLHFIVTPYNEKKKIKLEQLTKLYAPSYGLIAARLEVGRRIIPNKLTLGSIDNHDFLTKESLDKLIYDNLGYGSLELIEVWAEYTSSSTAKYELQEKIVKVIVADFNRLRRELKLPYSTEELNTGIPDSFKQFRENEG